MAQTLTQIKRLLAERGLQPKKRFGQNFLHDQNQMQRIVAAAQIEPGQLVLEVGAGTGSLSLRLLETAARLIAVEVDHDLEPILRHCLGQRAVLHIGDILASKHQVSPAVAQLIGDRPFKLVANLPYSVASPLVANLVTAYPHMTAAVVMVQREVADRLLARPGGKSFGPLGVMVQAMCEVKRVGVLGPSCFWPPPQVESAIIALRRRDKPLIDRPDQLSAMVQRLFGQRRKQLGTILGRSVELPEGIAADLRPENLSVRQIVELARYLG